MLTFAKTVDAVRFCHAAQTNVLYHRWPPEALDMCGAIEHTPDGRVLFRGPRVAMAVHETDDYEYVHSCCLASVTRGLALCFGVVWGVIEHP